MPQTLFGHFFLKNHRLKKLRSNKKEKNNNQQVQQNHFSKFQGVWMVFESLLLLVELKQTSLLPWHLKHQLWNNTILLKNFFPKFSC
jgi:hypothetical protein